MKGDLRSFGTVRAEDGDSNRVKAVISTGDIARDGAIIDPSGWDFEEYGRNPVVLYGHDDGSGGMFAGGSGAMPVARTVEGPVAGKNEITATAEFDSEDPVAMRLLSKIRRGFINATSVRWLPIRTEWIDKPDGERHEGEGEKVLVFREQKLLEWSFVPIPADPGAVVVRADGGPLAVEDYAETAQRPPPAAKPPTREELLDDADYLRSRLEAYGLEDFAKRLKMGEIEMLALLQRHLAAMLHRPTQGANTLSHTVERKLDELQQLVAAQPSPLEAFVATLARQTGRSEQTIRKEYQIA